MIKPNPTDVNPWVATAPRPTLTITGHAATISNVRFVWHIGCGFCRLSVPLWTDGGRIEASLDTGSRARNTGGARWFQTYRPASVPDVPERCPHEGCGQSTARVVGRQTVSVMAVDGPRRPRAGPFAVGPRMDQACPFPTVQADRLVHEAWAVLRREHPDLAAEADRSVSRAR